MLVMCMTVDHLAIPVADQTRSRRFYETYFGFDARPARRYDDGVLMLYDATGFALALGPNEFREPRPSWMHFGARLASREAVLELRDRLARNDVDLVEEWDEPDYVSVKCRDPDGYVVEAFWVRRGNRAGGSRLDRPPEAHGDPGPKRSYDESCGSERRTDPDRRAAARGRREGLPDRSVRRESTEDHESVVSRAPSARGARSRPV
jgi:catechol 2,3-dioxygenase-like lactoylglutathione lyase family enzyme